MTNRPYPKGRDENRSGKKKILIVLILFLLMFFSTIVAASGGIQAFAQMIGIRQNDSSNITVSQTSAKANSAASDGQSVLVGGISNEDSQITVGDITAGADADTLNATGITKDLNTLGMDMSVVVPPESEDMDSSEPEDEPVTSKPESSTSSKAPVPDPVSSTAPSEPSSSSSSSSSSTSSTSSNSPGGGHSSHTIHVTDVDLNKSELTLPVGSAEQLDCKVRPGNVDNKKVTWKSSDTSIATVDTAGHVAAVSAGTASITVTSVDRSKTASCKVTVTIPVIGMTLNKTSIQIEKGATETLLAQVKPDNATNKKVSWATQNNDIASVDENGLVTATGAGQTIITAATEDGQFKAQCVVSVGISIQKVVLDKEAITLNKGGTETLTAKVEPADTTEKYSFVWSSSDETIATVDEHGVITAVAGGKATITATAKDGISANCDITVNVPATSILLNKDTLTLIKGESEQILATVSPEDATDKKVEWKSSNESIATVSEDGTITALAGGDAVITAVTHDGGFTAECSLTVHVLVSGVTLDKEETTIIKGNTETLVATVLPDDASNKAVTWASSNENIAKVDQHGMITALAGGDATITVTTKENNHTAQCLVHVRVPVTGISLNKTDATIIKNQTEQLTATILPEDATDKAITWVSSDESVATVDENGLVTAHKAGNPIITATTHDGSFTVTCNVTVIVPVTSITLNKAETTILKNKTEQLTATILPDDATDTAVTWISSNPAIATVDEHGLIKAAAGGDVTITVKTHDGGFTSSCLVHVRVPVTGIVLNKTTASIARGTSETLTAVIQPADATNKGITWISSNSSVAAVDVSGKVTAVQAGNTVITAATQDGGFTASCQVNVWVPVTGVSLSQTTAQITEGETLQLTAAVAPYDATNKAITWTTSDGTIANVSSGLVTAIKAGTITVTASCEGHSGSCAVTVKPKYVTMYDASLPSGSQMSQNIAALSDYADAGSMLSKRLSCTQGGKWIQKYDSNSRKYYNELSGDSETSILSHGYKDSSKHSDWWQTYYMGVKIPDNLISKCPKQIKITSSHDSGSSHSSTRYEYGPGYTYNKPVKAKITYRAFDGDSYFARTVDGQSIITDKTGDYEVTVTLSNISNIYQDKYCFVGEDKGCRIGRSETRPLNVPFMPILCSPSEGTADGYYRGRNVHSIQILKVEVAWPD